MKNLISEMMEGIHELNRTIVSSTNTRRELVACASKLDTIARRLGNGRLEAMMHETEEMRVPKTAKVQEAPKPRPRTCEMGTQTNPHPTWAISKAPKVTSIKEGNPLVLDASWDLAVMREKKDSTMELGIQRFFRNRYEEIAAPQGEIRKEDESPE